MLNEDEIARGVIKALKSDEVHEILMAIVATKLELTAGWNCRDPKERQEIVNDQRFIRDLRMTTRSGMQQVLGWLFAILAGGFLTYLGVKAEFLK